ncbi:Gfo/Idh/MocA family oxidoreductase [Alloacidobacterium dinghuense]|uniref:Gfo/Idh/MocA family oxidoreductase n=1 Tax=Alloacidobacterium dinghuense TaxID=2763107 RepID=A0A7G8BGF6_9BACT|nr:Gfo/Idh/MocA family oxidoreductase [Alloacidobacterium dinghuense]QNI31626.1 Gfo/Idh/MocA family oxidoreductase [Alloacidobacterium dinghuense]
MRESATQNVAVFGAGVFGRNHLRVYRTLQESDFPVRLAAIVESDTSRTASLEQEWGLPVYGSIDAFLSDCASGNLQIDAASVCVPTIGHFQAASALLANGIDVLVEKPIAASLEEAGQLTALANQHRRVLQIGHLERFNPAVAAVRGLLNGPMFFEAHRLSVFSPRSLDVDVVLDLMIHDLDIVLTFAQSPVSHVHAVGLPILSPKVDIANVRVEFESGCVANFTASRVSTERVRKLRFFQPHQYVSIDYARQDLLVINVEARATANSGVVGNSSGLSMQKPQVTQGEPLRFEIESFLECVRSRRRPVVSGEDGREALKAALQINAAIDEHARRARLDRYTA